VTIYKYQWQREKISGWRESIHRLGTEGFFFRYKNLISRQWQLLFLACVTLFHLILYLAFQFTGLAIFEGAPECSAPVLIPSAFMGVTYVIILIIFLVASFGVHDIYYIKVELLCVVLIVVPCYILWAAAIFTDFTFSSYFTMSVSFGSFLCTIVLPIALSFKKEWVPLHDVNPDDLKIILQQFQAKREQRKMSDSLPLTSETPSEAGSEIHLNVPGQAPSTRRPSEVVPVNEDCLAVYLRDEIYQDSFKMYCIQAWCVEVSLFFFFFFSFCSYLLLASPRSYCSSF